MRWSVNLLFWACRSIVEALKPLAAASAAVAALALAFALADHATTREYAGIWQAPVSASEQLRKLGLEIGAGHFQSIADSPSLLVILLALAAAVAARVFLGVAAKALWRRTTPAAKQKRLLGEIDQALKQAQSA